MRGRGLALHTVAAKAVEEGKRWGGGGCTPEATASRAHWRQARPAGDSERRGSILAHARRRGTCGAGLVWPKETETQKGTGKVATTERELEELEEPHGARRVHRPHALAMPCDETRQQQRTQAEAVRKEAGASKGPKKRAGAAAGEQDTCSLCAPLLLAHRKWRPSDLMVSCTPPRRLKMMAR